MKITGLILIILGSLMLIFNLLAYLNPKRASPPLDLAERFGYYLGFNSLFIVGAILLLIGILLWKKAKKRKTVKDLLSELPGDA